MKQENYQQRVDVWMNACFGSEITKDRVERNFRFLEESVELVQANGATMEQAHMLVDYVFGRPQGEVFLETGGVMVTLAALCTAAELDMEAAGEAELIRIEPMKEKIAAKQRTKPKNSPLPGGNGKLPLLAGSYFAQQTTIAAAGVLADFGLPATVSCSQAFGRLQQAASFRWFLWSEAVADAVEPMSADAATETPAWIGDFSALLARFGRVGEIPGVGPEFIDPFARGVHRYWRGAVGRYHDWNGFKADMPGQVAMFRQMAMAVAASEVMRTWSATESATVPEEAVHAMAEALYRSWGSSPRGEQWTKDQHRCFVGKARSAAAALEEAGIGLEKTDS